MAIGVSLNWTLSAPEVEQGVCALFDCSLEARPSVSEEEFLEIANKYSGCTVTVEMKDTKPNQVLTIRNTVEVVSRRIIVLENNAERRAKPDEQEERYL